MNRVQKLYRLWSENTFFDPETRAELAAVADRPAEIEDRFYTDLSFGTAGLRGVLGAGTNRMNRYTVLWAADGFARYLAGQGEAARKQGIVISYDSRHHSDEFALLTACVMVRYGVRVRLSDSLRPVPLLSFAIRKTGAVGGVMITASHNPPSYNGFKAYGPDGAQLPPEAATEVSRRMQETADWTTLVWPDEAKAKKSELFSWWGPKIDEQYQQMLQQLVVDHDSIRERQELKIVYTPLHGTGLKPVQRILTDRGFKNVFIVPEQSMPDPDFSTVKVPNPEDRAALDLAIRLAEAKNADIVIATDPDADRTGLAVRNREGEMVLLSGNQIGILLTDYILSGRQQAGTLPERSFVVTTVVSGRLTGKIAAHYGVKVFECLTGFKYIAELIYEHDEMGDMHFMFGFEESFGYLAGTDVRDKDGVVTSMLIAEMAASARRRDLTVYELLEQLYERFGYAQEETISVVKEGKEGLQAIERTMARLRAERDSFAQLGVRYIRDYQELVRIDVASGQHQELVSDASNVLIYELSGLDWFGVRPSGTEPKIKIYFGCYDEEKKAGRDRLEQNIKLVESHIRSLLAGESDAH